MSATPTSAAGESHRNPPGAQTRIWLAALPVAALFALAYGRTFAALWDTWLHNDNYSHGPLVPVVSAVLVWSRRKRLARLPIEGRASGLLLVAAACALQIVGIRTDVLALQGWSALGLLFGLSLSLLGAAWTRALAFPLAFLAFMLPFPAVFVNQLSFALKEITVRISTRAAEWLGASLLRDGMTLYLQSGELRIENPCSGLRSLIALLATGALFAGIQRGAWWRRASLFALALPIAVLANAARITLLIVIGHYLGVERAGGLVHDVSGYLLYALAVLALLGARALLEPRAHEPRPPALEAMAR